MGIVLHWGQRSSCSKSGETVELNVEKTYASLGISLSRAGERWKGLCPFHAESDGSFVVYTDGSYHCFGCQAHGTLKNLLKHYGEDIVVVQDIGQLEEKFPIDLKKMKNDQYDELYFLLEGKNFEKKKKAWKAFDFIWVKDKILEENQAEFIRRLMFVKTKFKEILKFVKMS